MKKLLIMFIILFTLLALNTTPVFAKGIRSTHSTKIHTIKITKTHIHKITAGTRTRKKKGYKTPRKTYITNIIYY